MTHAVSEGDLAPAVELTLEDGSVWRSADGVDEPTVLFFYPKDDTSGCTTEAIGFSELMPAFEDAGTIVIGVSADPAQSHAKFKAKHGLRVHLAVDPEQQAMQAFGVWGEKSMYGRKYMGVERSTFLLAPGGRVARSWRKVNAAGHAEEVLDAVRGLKALGT